MLNPQARSAPLTTAAGTPATNPKASFAPSAVRTDTGAVSMSQRHFPSRDTEAGVVVIIPTMNASTYGMKSATIPLISSGTAASGLCPSAEATAMATEATSASTDPTHAFMK